MHKKIYYGILFVICCCLFIGYIIIDMTQKVKPVSFIPNDKLIYYDQDALNDFYNLYPETIKHGKYVDIKLTHYNQFKQEDSVLTFVYKGDNYKEITELKFTFYDEKGNREETALGYIDPFEHYPYEKYAEKREIARIFNQPLKNICNDMNNLDNRRYKLDHLNVKVSYGNEEVEEFEFTVDYEKLLDMNTYTLDNSIDDIILNYRKNKGNLEYYVKNMNILYIYTGRNAETDISNFFENIKKSSYRNEIIENIALMNVFENIEFYNLNESELKNLYNLLKQLYAENSNLNFTGYVRQELLNIMEKLNETFYEKELNYLFQPKEYTANDISSYDINELFTR